MYHFKVVFPTIKFTPDDGNNDVWHRDVALVCCLLAGHSAGGNGGAEGIAKELSPP